MFYLACVYGFVKDADANYALAMFCTNIRKAQGFKSFREAEEVAKHIGLKYYTILSTFVPDIDLEIMPTTGKEQ
jgi:hypothetical protein